jgi:hypothetical protein
VTDLLVLTNSNRKFNVCFEMIITHNYPARTFVPYPALFLFDFWFVVAGENAQHMISTWSHFRRERNRSLLSQFFIGDVDVAPDAIVPVA